MGVRVIDFNLALNDGKIEFHQEQSKEPLTAPEHQPLYSRACKGAIPFSQPHTRILSPDRQESSCLY
jgi:hypothetical protein